MWKIKALIQFVFAKLPFGEWLNYMAQRARGAYTDAAQAQRLVIQGKNIGLSNARFDLDGKVALEIGAGWNGIGCLLLYLFGVSRNYAYDHKRHLRFSRLKKLVELANESSKNLSDAMGIDEQLIVSRLALLEPCETLESLLDTMGVAYCAPGDAGKTDLPDGSIDYVFSYGVLEHVPRDDLAVMFREQTRIISSNGRAYHNIGLHDHFHSAGLGNGVNFLRYSERKWAFFCYNDILYHNRLRLPHFLELIEESGLTIAWQDTELTENNIEALRKLNIDSAFSGLSEEDLATSHLYVDLVNQPVKAG